MTWDDETMDKWLTNPKKFIKGTKMVFAGIKKDKERAPLPPQESVAAFESGSPRSGQGELDGRPWPVVVR